MNYFPLTTAQQEWQERTTEISARDIGPHAAEYDQKAAFLKRHCTRCATPVCGRYVVPQQYGGLGPIR